MSTISARSALALADLSDGEPVIMPVYGWTMMVNTEKDEPLRQAQLELDAMKEQCRVLQEKTCIAEANKMCRSSKKAVPDSLSSFDQEVQSLSKKYGILIEMFPPSRDILSCPLTPGVSNASPAPLDVVGKAQYASGLAEEAAIVAELDSSLPAHIQNIRMSSHFADQTRINSSEAALALAN
ncbi:hypothetical protein OG21DRAFT_1525941 [Imleria badia]|nr:hypothetical protein OG21DRAFT_1525941 [Imleria badia]